MKSRGKAYVAWKSWHEAYKNIVDKEYLDALTLEKCEETAFRLTDHFMVAIDDGRVIGFVGYGDRGDEAPDIGEIFALYVLSDYFGKNVGLQLMNAGLEQLKNNSEICLWVFKENRRAIRFYQKCGFAPDGEEMMHSNAQAIMIRMILNR